MNTDPIFCLVWNLSGSGRCQGGLRGWWSCEFFDGGSEERGVNFSLKGFSYIKLINHKIS